MTNIFPQRTVIVEIMPMCLIETHRAANNFGKYPMNGSFRELVSEEEAEERIKEYPEYNHIVHNSLRTLWKCRNGYVIKNYRFIIWVDYSIGAFSATEIKSNNRKSNLGTKKLPTIETSEELQIVQLHNILDDLERNYENITLLVGFPSVDTVFLDIDAPSNFPNMNYIPCVKIELQKGHGLQWVKETFGCEPDRFIDGKQG